MADVIRRDQTIDRLVAEKLRDQYEAEKEEHVSSGKLSASMLWWPVQWQVLKNIGYPAKEPEDYVLGKFLRGDHVEAWLIENMPGVINPDTNPIRTIVLQSLGAVWDARTKQWGVEFHDVVGHIDAVVDSSFYEFNFGIIPHEVKSVSNAKYKNILREMKPDMAHALQAAFYALAIGSKQFAIDYVATDDYRVESFVLDVEKYADMVDMSVTKYNKAMQVYNNTGFIPEFEPNEPWQANPMYNRYPDCVHISDEKKAEILKVIELTKKNGGK